MHSVLYVNYYLRGKVNKQGKQPLKAVVTFKGDRFEFSSGIYVTRNDWNSKKQEFSKGFLLRFEFKDHIQELTKKIYQFYFADDNKSLPHKRFKNELYKFLEPSKSRKNSKSVHEVWSEYLNYKKMRVSWATHQKYTHLFETHFKGFENWTGKIYDFEDFDLNFLDKLIEYFFDVKNHNNNTVEKNISNLIVFLKWAYERGFSENSNFLKFNKGDNSIKTYIPDTMSLSFKDLQKLLNSEMNSDILERTRLIFLFMIFTGQRIKDYENLQWSDITEDGLWLLRQKKENYSRITVPLNDFCIEVLQKFKGLGKPLPITKKFNLHLKTLGKELEFNEPFTKTSISGGSQNRLEETNPKWMYMTAHCSRRTFVSLTSELKIRDEVGMKVSGHKVNEMYRHYNKLNMEVAQKEFLQPWNDKIKTLRRV